MNLNFILSDEQLREIIPNQLVTVKGETPLFDKLVPFLSQSEQWLLSRFLPAEILDSLTEEIWECCSRIVAFDAYCRALPMLDVVVTPNGLATVGSQNLTAASKARADRLTDGLTDNRDRTIARLLTLLPSVKGWPESDQGGWFAATLFPTLDICSQSGVNELLWDRYCELRMQIVDLEASLSEEWFSPELLSALREENLRGCLSFGRKVVVSQIQAQILCFLKTKALDSRRLADIVSYIRHRPKEFPEWFDSDVADLFSPPVFRNDKGNKGYFF